ncbi:NYN domain-containing protein [Paracoccaceae bacterium Fryx2]|nr:NYN domain-containing protein [Paracoccaceae bacterium Fryx2]
MMQAWAGPVSGGVPNGAVAVLVDGENVAWNVSEVLLRCARTLGAPTILRAYCNRLNPNGWDGDGRFQLTYLDTQAGKNSADIRLVIDAMDIVHAAAVDSIVIASTDRDFAPLAHRLRASGLYVLGVGRREASAIFRHSCSDFHVLNHAPEPAPPPQPVVVAARAVTRPAALSKEDALIHDLIRSCGKDGWLELTRINPHLSKSGFMIGDTPEKTWRAYLEKRDTLYDCEPRGPTARVRLRQR